MASTRRGISSGESLLLPAHTTITSQPPERASRNPARSAAPTPTVRPISSTSAPPALATSRDVSVDPSSTTRIRSTMLRGTRRTTSPIFLSSSKTGTTRTTRRPRCMSLGRRAAECSPVFAEFEARRLLLHGRHRARDVELVARAKSEEELPHEALVRKVRGLDSEVHRFLVVEPRGAEHPVEDRKVIAEVAVSANRILHMVPQVHLGTDEDGVQRAETDAGVGMVEHAEKDVDSRPDEQRRLVGAEHGQRQQEDHAIEQFFERMETNRRQEVHLLGAVVGFVKPPPPVPAMLEAVHH